MEDGHPAQPLPGAGIPIIALGGDITLYWVGGSAGYLSQLYLDVLGNQVVFSNDGSPQLNRTISGVPAGTELVFRIVVDGGRHTWYSGPASRNVDGVVHAAVCDWLPDTTVSSSGKFVGFEDWPGDPAAPRAFIENAGNGDFNDLMFVIHQEVPEPSTVLLVVSALGAFAVFSRRARIR